MNKHDDMPDVIYVNKHVEEVSEMFEEDPDVYKYHSNKSFLAAIAELKRKHEEEMLGVVEDISLKTFQLGGGETLEKYINSIKSRIGDKK